MTTLGNDTDGDEQAGVAINVGYTGEKCDGHREIEDAGDLDLPEVEWGPWRSCSEEPPREAVPAMPTMR